VSEDVGVRKSIFVGEPDEFEFFVFLSRLIVHPIHSSEEPGIEAHLSKQSSIGVGVSKRINLPSNSRLDAKVLGNELMTNHMVVDHIFVDGACFIVHGPSTIDKLKLSIRNHKLCVVLHLFIL